MPTPRSRLLWAVFAALLVHVAEELPNFPAWATAHFGTTTPRWFVLSHIPILGLAAWITARATRSNASDGAMWWMWVLIVALATNGVFHVAATLWFHEYSPGVVTSVLLYGPLFWLASRRLPRPAGAPRMVGVLVAFLLTGSLWLDMPTL